MRRAISTGPLSPKLIKHSAIATVALTGLLAIFASGEDWGAQAQIGTVEAKNQLAATEAERFGSKKLAAKLRVKDGPAASAFGDDEGHDFGAYGGGDSPQKPSPEPALTMDNSRAYSPGLPNPPSAIAAVNGAPAPVGAAQLKSAKARSQSGPTAQDIADITANSARRSGQAGGAD